jgi:cyclophilin family peptidyl-prolyl cis-trans isomerase
MHRLISSVCIQPEIYEADVAMAVNLSMVKHFLMKHSLSNIINVVYSVSDFYARVQCLASDFMRTKLPCVLTGMANKGYRHSNGSQFYITLSDACQWMSNRFVAFGRVVEGFDTLIKLEQIDTINQRPVKGVRIVNCGIVHIQDD